MECNVHGIGKNALAEVTTGSHIIAIGNGAGSKIHGAHFVILVGDDVQAPSKDATFYINFDGKEYPWETRKEAWFQDAVRQRAHAMIDAMSPEDISGGDPQFLGSRAEAHERVNEMSFYEEHDEEEPSSYNAAFGAGALSYPATGWNNVSYGPNKSAWQKLRDLLRS